MKALAAVSVLGLVVLCASASADDVCSSNQSTQTSYECSADQNNTLNTELDGSVTAVSGTGLTRCTVKNPVLQVEETRQLTNEQVDTWSACAGTATVVRTKSTIIANVSYTGTYSACENTDSPRIGQAANVSTGMICNVVRYDFSKVVQQ